MRGAQTKRNHQTKVHTLNEKETIKSSQNSICIVMCNAHIHFTDIITKGENLPWLSIYKTCLSP